MQTQTLWLGCLVAVGVAGSPGLAQPPLHAVAGPVGPGPTPPPLTVDYHALIEGLREMHNSGADLFNLGDSAGCYHFFRGCLTATRSLLNAHPDLQALIDQRLQQAAAMPQMARRAFLLRETVEQVRDRLKAATPTATPTPVNAAVAGCDARGDRVVPTSRGTVAGPSARRRRAGSHALAHPQLIPHRCYCRRHRCYCHRHPHHARHGSDGAHPGDGQARGESLGGGRVAIPRLEQR
jgi:hypothetical protein